MWPDGIAQEGRGEWHRPAAAWRYSVVAVVALDGRRTLVARTGFIASAAASTGVAAAREAFEALTAGVLALDAPAFDALAGTLFEAALVAGLAAVFAAAVFVVVVFVAARAFIVMALVFSRRVRNSSRIMTCAARAMAMRCASGAESSALKNAALTGLVPRGERVEAVSVLAMVGAFVIATELITSTLVRAATRIILQISIKQHLRAGCNYAK